MSALLTPVRHPAVETGHDEAAARAALRAQIARLETQLAAQQTTSRARRPAAFTAAVALRYEDPPRRAPAPRLLALGELETQRDALADALHEERRAEHERGTRHEDARRLREEMLLDPSSHQYVRVSNDDIGEPGCHSWHVRPSYGMLGRLMRWWRVRISSGCP